MVLNFGKNSKNLFCKALIFKKGNVPSIKLENVKISMFVLTFF